MSRPKFPDPLGGREVDMPGARQHRASPDQPRRVAALEESLRGAGLAIFESLLTTRGDMIRRNATEAERFAVGTTGQYLGSNGTDPFWTGPPYTLYFQHLPFNPVDATTYYFGAWRSLAPNTAEGSRYCVALRTGNVRSAALTWLGLTASGTNENISMYVRNVTAGTEELIETIGNTAQVKLFNNYAMTLAVTEGDLIEIKFVCPTWTTNPTGVDITGHVLIG